MKFAFGKNWTSFAQSALSEEQISQARDDFHALLHPDELKDKRFLDIGFGQGISLHLAREAGAEVLGLDVDSDNLDALEQTSRFFDSSEPPATTIGSILDPSFVEHIKGREGFDVVHSWGVLHHTGDMNLAFQHAASLCRPGGLFAVSIYNRHWSSVPWRWIKFLYNLAPSPLRAFFIWTLYPIIYCAKWLVTRENPLKKERGMDFYHDVVDWVGGYPYEFASADELRERCTKLGFTELRFKAPQVPTGCNEFVFRKE